MIENIPAQIVVSVLSNDIEFKKWIILLIGIFFAYIILYKKLILSFMDPLLMMVVYAAFSAFIPLYMYMNDMMYSSEYIFQFLFTEVFLCAGIYASKLKLFNAYSEHGGESRFYNIKRWIVILSSLYIFSLLIYIVSVDELPIAVFFSGIGSRLETNQHNVIAYIANLMMKSLMLPLAILSFRIYLLNKRILHMKYVVINLIAIMVGMVLGGSKIALLGMLFYIFFAISYRQNEIDEKRLINLKRGSVLLFCLIIFMAVFVFVLTSGEDYMLWGFMYRILTSGDIFLLYSYDFFQWIDVEDYFIKWLFNPLLSTIKLISWSDAPMAIGYQAELLMHPDSPLGGPNSRHNVVGYLYFGFYGSIISSFIIGYVIGLIRRKWLLLMNDDNISSYILYSYIYLTITRLPTGADSVPLDIFTFFIVYKFVEILYSAWGRVDKA